jgi:hypothetical protein
VIVTSFVTPSSYRTGGQPIYFVVLSFIVCDFSPILLPRLHCCNDYATALSSTPKYQVPSFDHWKSKCWQDLDLTKSLRDYAKPNYPQAIRPQGGAGMWPKPFVTRPDWSYRPTRFNSNHPWRLVISRHPSVTADPSHSVASTVLMTSLFSLVMMATFSMILVDLSQEATRNWGPCRTSFDKSPERSDWQIDYTQSGLDNRVFAIVTTDAHISF